MTVEYGRRNSWMIGILASTLCLTISESCTSPIPSGDENDAGGGQQAEPSWKIVHQGLPSALLSIQVVSNGDVYAVGSDSRDGNGPYVLRYEGQQWTRLVTGVQGDLWWVHEVEPDEIWMCGSDRLILRYQPSTGDFTPFDAGGGTDTLFGIWGLSTVDIWAVGGGITEGVVLRYDGRTWSDIDLEDVLVDQILPPMFKVWGPRENDVWIVGMAGIALHFDGSAFALLQSESKRTFFTVHGDTEGNVVAAVGGFLSAQISELLVGEVRDVTPEGALQVNGVHFGVGGEVVAAGIQASTLRRTPDGWVVEENGLVEISDLDFHAVWADPEGNAWAVGGNTTVAPLDRGMVAFFGTGNPAGMIAE